MNLALARSIFGKPAEIYLPFLEPFADLAQGISYKFMPVEEFLSVLDEHPAEATRIYWSEMLDRAHLTAVTSILRNKRWLNGVLNAVEHGNLLVFGAALRGFVESAADACEALRLVPLTLAESYEDIKSAVEGRLEHGIVVNAELEDALIHFSHGRKLPRDSTVAKSHRAKTSRHYLNILQGADHGDMHDCYSDLCEISHPAALTVHFFFDKPSRDEFTLNDQNDRQYIEAFCAKYRSVMTPIFHRSFNPALITLKLLNSFPVNKLKTPFLDGWDCESIGLWRKVKSYMK